MTEAPNCAPAEPTATAPTADGVAPPPNQFLGYCDPTYTTLSDIPRYEGVFDKPEHQERFDRLQRALELILQPAADADILAVSPVKERQLARLIQNVFEDQGDDGIVGLRALVYRSGRGLPAPIPLSQAPSSRSFLNCCPMAHRDMAQWPDFDDSNLSGERKARFDRVVRGVERLLAGAMVKEAAEIAGVSESRFRDLFRRAMKVKPGTTRILGLEAFAGYVHSVRRRGKFGSLFQRYVQLESVLTAELLKDKRPNKIHEHQLVSIFRKIIDPETGAVPIPLDEYPHNAPFGLRRPLVEWYQREFMARYMMKVVAHEDGPDAAKALGYTNGDGQASRPSKPYECWEIDEYRIDLFTRFVFPGVHGSNEQLDLPRFYVIVVRERTLGVIIAWRLVLAKQPSAADMALLLRDAVMGQQLARPVMGAATAVEGAGYPATIFPALRWMGPKLILLDNALSHLADVVQEIIVRLFGDGVRFGSAGTPKDRPFVESEIRTAARRVFQQLPNSSGSHPRDPVRKASARRPDFRVEVPALEHCLCGYFTNINVHPKQTSGYNEPFTLLARLINDGALRYLVAVPQFKRRAHYFSLAVERAVRFGDGAHKRPNHINFQGVRYSSKKLRTKKAMARQRLVLRPDYRNLQYLVAFNTDNTEFGVLVAEGVWGRFPHDQRVRSTYAKYRAQAALGPRADDLPMQVLFQYLESGAKSDSTMALELAYILDYFRRNIDTLKFSQLDGNLVIDGCVQAVPEGAEGDHYNGYMEQYFELVSGEEADAPPEVQGHAPDARKRIEAPAAPALPAPKPSVVLAFHQRTASAAPVQRPSGSPPPAPAPQARAPSQAEAPINATAPLQVDRIKSGIRLPRFPRNNK